MSAREEPLEADLAHTAELGRNPTGGARARGWLQSGSGAELIPKEPKSPREFPLRASEPEKKPGGLIRHLVSFPWLQIPGAAKRK